MNGRARIACFGLATFVMLVGCAVQRIDKYRVVDVNSRREYTAVGQPNFLQGGAINFYDPDSKRMIVLQSYEMFGLEGEQLYVQLNPWTNRYEVVKAPAKK